MAKKQGLYSDLDEFIEEGGRHNVEKGVEQEGNIPSGKFKEDSAASGSRNIPSSDPKPESPKREGNIQPSSGENPEESARRIQRQESATPEGPESKGNIDPQEEAAPENPRRGSIDPKENPPESSESQSIPVSEQAPGKPQRRGNIEPRQFDPKKGQVQRDANGSSKPETPRRKENIRPNQSNRPDNPNRVSRQPNEKGTPDEVNQGSRNPKAGARPQESNQGSRQARDEATPNKVNQRSREARSGAKPSGPNQNQRNPKTGATPQSPPQSQRKAREESRPQDPQRRVINLREAAGPSTPNQRGNISPSEEPPTTEPTEGADIDVNAENQPPQSEQTQNIKSKERRPDSPRRQENIGADETSRPQEPSRTENISSKQEAAPQEPNRSEIQAEENKPQPPPTTGNISPTEESEPSGPAQRGNISPDEGSEPEETSRENNISPREESQPPQVNSDESISPIEESKPKSPTRQENINPTEESEPESPNRSGSISPESPEPENPSQEQNIQPPEEPRPSSPQGQSNIPQGENPEPESPNRSENISPTEESEPENPIRSGNISQAEESQPEAPSRQQNISPPEEPQPSSSQSEGNISPKEESEPKGPNRTQIESEDSRPPSPQAEENISPTEESQPKEPNRSENITSPEEPQPEEPNRQSAIDGTEESEPSEPSREDNIAPTEESEPEEPSKEENIVPPEEPEPPSPDSDGAIAPTKGSEPQEPQKEENIPPTEESEPSEPDQGGFISPTEESEPSRPDQGGFISPTEESEPQEPQKEGNIDPSNEGVTDGTGDEPLSEPQKEGNIDPTDSENTDGIGGEEIDREQPLKFQPARFSSQIDPENVDFVDTVAGSEDAAPEWRPPLRYQPETYVGQIDPSDEGGRYQLERFVAGSNEPGDNVRNMAYDNEGADEALRFQNVVNEALDSGTIDPNFEGGIYSLPSFVAGSNEPGDNVRNMAYDQDGASENLRFQPENIRQKLRGGTIINPSDEGGRYVSKNFVAGNDEPGDNIRDMGYSFAQTNAPLRHQPEEIRQKLRDGGVIDSSDEGGRYQLETFVAGSNEPGDNIRNMAYDNEGVSESLRFQKAVNQALDNGTINPSFEGGRYLLPKFVAGSNEPGDDVRDMSYDQGGASEGLRHQPKNIQEKLRGGTIINPDDEGGRYHLEQFVAGSDEPGGDIRDMGYDFSQTNAPLRHQPKNVRQKLRDGGVIDEFRDETNFDLDGNEPGDELPEFRDSPFGAESSHSTQNNGPVLNPVFNTGAPKKDELLTQNDRVSAIVGEGAERKFPSDNSNREYSEPLEFQKQNIKSKLRNGTLINPDNEGGRYQLEQFVVGSNEPGDQLSEFGSTGDPQGESTFGSESSHASNNNGPVLNPAFNNFEPKQVELVLQNERVSVVTEGAFPQSENGIEERNEPLEHQSKRLEGQINPNNPNTTDGVGGNFPSSENATIEANETEEFQTRFQGEIEDLNRTIRLSQFDSLFGDGRTDLPVADTPIPRAEFTQASIGPDQPFILRRPEAGGGSALIANAKQADSRAAPVASAAEDTVRISKFFATGKGITYNVKQQFLQSQNPRTRTRIYDPTSPIQTSASGMAVRPGQQITRHVSADSGPLGLVGDAASAIGDIAGFDVPQSSRYEDELEEEAVDTEWGEMQGSLFWLSPVAQRALPEVTGEGARTRINQIRSGNVQNIKPLFSTSEQDQLSQFAAAALGRQGGIGNGYLFTNSYDPQGGPEGEGREETDNYHPSVPYVRNVGSMNSRREPTGSAYVAPEFSSPGEQLRALTTAARNAKDSVFPFINSNATPSTDNITDGRGNVITQRQNDTTSEVYYENRVIERGGDRIPAHRGVQQKENHGLPNYSKKNEDGEKINRIDWINRLEPIVGKDADPEQETFGEGQHKDFIPFKFYDVENEGLIVFRAFLEGISDNLSPEWSQQDYAGRPEQGHIYGGYSNTISFSFQVAPFSKEEFKAQWKKINYLKGLTTPSGYSFSAGAGTYMTPPFMRMTIGDMFNDVYGYMNSLTISVNDDMDWEIDQDVGRLPRGIEVDVDWQVIEKRAPLALQKFYDAPFIDAIEEPTRESPEPREEVLPKSADDAAERPGIDTNRAINQSTESDSSGGDAPVNPEDTTPFADIPNFTS